MSERTAEYVRLSVAERLDLISEIWESVVSEGHPLPLTEAQRSELDRRLAAHEVSPANVVDWEIVKRTPPGGV